MTFIQPKPPLKVEFSTRETLSNTFDPQRLLCEWFNWWVKSDIPPGRFPDSLITRTVMALSARDDQVVKDADS